MSRIGYLPIEYLHMMELFTPSNTCFIIALRLIIICEKCIGSVGELEAGAPATTHVDAEAAPVAEPEQHNLEMLLREELIMQEIEKYFDSAKPGLP